MLRQTLQTAGRAVSRELSGRYRIIYLIAVVEALFCFIFPGLVNDDYDTWTYFDTWKFYFLSRPETFIDSYRTPVYPLFMSLTSLDGLLPLTSIAFAQWIVFILIIPWFRRLAHMLVRSESITFWMTLFYVAYWGVIDVNYWIRTESLSQSFLILFVYYTIRAMRKLEKKSLVWSAFWLLILVFLRPAFLYLPPIYIAVCLYIMARNRRKGLMGLLGASVVCGIIYGYAAAFEHRHGFFAISDVSDYNNYYRLVQYDIIDASCFPSYLLPAMINTDSVPGDTIWTYNIPSWIHHTTDFHEGVNANISKHKDEFAYATLWTFPSFWRCRANQCQYLYWPVGMMLTLGMDTAAILVMIYLAVAILSMIRYRQVMPVPLLIGGIWIAQGIVVWVGAYWNFDRLMTPVFPMLILIFGQLCSFYTKTRTAREVFTPC